MELKVDSSKFKDDIMSKIEELSGQNIFSCYLCGKCSAGCPVVSDMDILPHQIMRFLQLGAYEIPLNSKTIWLCASCFTCGVRCPKGVDIAKVNEALRLMVLRESRDYINISEIKQKDLEELPPIALVSNFRKYTS